jgi:hypothetical protein
MERRHETRPCLGHRPIRIVCDRRRHRLEQINTRAQHGETTAAVIDDKGNLHVPSDYRTTYQMLGSRAVARDNGPGSKQLHGVYASPGTIAAYRKDGHFPDGTVLVKEVLNTTTKEMTTGTVSSAGTLAGAAS